MTLPIGFKSRVGSSHIDLGQTCFCNKFLSTQCRNVILSDKHIVDLHIYYRGMERTLGEHIYFVKDGINRFGNSPLPSKVSTHGTSGSAQ